MSTQDNAVSWDDVITSAGTIAETLPLTKRTSDTSTYATPSFWDKTFDPKTIDVDNLNRSIKEYTVTGAHEPDEAITEITESILKNLVNSKYVARLGHDVRSPFEVMVRGVLLRFGGLKKYYLPWKKFGTVDELEMEIASPDEEAYCIAAHYHPGFNDLSPPVRAIIARTVHMLLGKDLHSPVSFLLCYDKYGYESSEKMKIKTTTLGVMLSIAQDSRIPVFNIRREESIIKFVDYIRKLSEQNQSEQS